MTFVFPRMRSSRHGAGPAYSMYSISHAQAVSFNSCIAQTQQAPGPGRYRVFIPLPGACWAQDGMSSAGHADTCRTAGTGRSLRRCSCFARLVRMILYDLTRIAVHDCSLDLFLSGRNRLRASFKGSPLMANEDALLSSPCKSPPDKQWQAHVCSMM